MGGFDPLATEEWCPTTLVAKEGDLKESRSLMHATMQRTVGAPTKIYIRLHAWEDSVSHEKADVQKDESATYIILRVRPVEQPKAVIA